MIFVREDEQPTRDPESIGQNQYVVTVEKKDVNVLLQRVERSESFRVRKTIVLAAVDDQLRRRPFIHIFGWGHPVT